MLNAIARAQLAGFLATIEADETKTIPLGTLRHFIGDEGVDAIKLQKAELATEKKNWNKSGMIGEGARRYWAKFKLLKRREAAAFASGDKKREAEIGRASERLRDDFYLLVPESQQRYFRIHNGPEDEENWDWRWGDLEGRPPLLREELETGFPVNQPMNFAQRNFLSDFLRPPLSPEEQAEMEGRRTDHFLKMRAMREKQ